MRGHRDVEPKFLFKEVIDTPGAKNTVSKEPSVIVHFRYCLAVGKPPGPDHAIPRMAHIE